MAASDDIFKNISQASKQATDELKRTIEEFKRLQGMVGKINPVANRVPTPSNISLPSAQIQSSSIQAAISNMQQIHSSRLSMSPPSFRLPYNTAPLPPAFTPTGVGHVDSVLSSVQRGANGGSLFRRAMDLARNGSIDPGIRANTLNDIVSLSGRRGNILNPEQVEKLTYNTAALS